MCLANPPFRRSASSGLGASAASLVSPRDSTNPPVDYERALSLFSGKYTADLFTRQADAIKKIARDRASGLPVPELASVRAVCSKVLELMHQ